MEGKSTDNYDPRKTNLKLACNRHEFPRLIFVLVLLQSGSIHFSSVAIADVEHCTNTAQGRVIQRICTTGSNWL